jgi:hypothetical protein
MLCLLFFQNPGHTGLLNSKLHRKVDTHFNMHSKIIKRSMKLNAENGKDGKGKGVSLK